MIYLLLAPQSTEKPGQALAVKHLEFGSSFPDSDSHAPIPRIDKIEVFAATSQPDLGTDSEIGVLAQKAALDAAHALLSAQPLLWNEERLGPLWADFYLDGDINTEIRGDSGGLAYGLRLLEELTKYDADGSQRFADAHSALSKCVIGATGTVDVLGRVGRVNGVEAKLSAFINQLQRDWAIIQTNTRQEHPRIVFLLPKENLEQLDPQFLAQAQATLHNLSPHVEMVGISALADAIKTLVGDKFPIAQQDQFPYKGLSAFDPEDRLLFFGRELKVKDTLAKLKDYAAVNSAHRHCIVFGDSGSGKSSFVKAGLLPRLSQQRDSTLQNWAILKPGDAQEKLLDYLIHCLRPTLGSKDQDQLAALPWRKNPQAAVEGFMSLYGKTRSASHSSSSNESKTAGSAPVFVLVIDQAEELLRLPNTNDDITAFKDIIQVFSTKHLAISFPIEEPETTTWVISTIRLSDYENYKTFLALENEQAHYFACPLATLDPLEDVAAYRAIIENPAKLRGIAIDPGLTQHLLTAIAELKNPLPTLEYTLHELYLHTVNSHTLAKGLSLQAFKDNAVIGSMSGLITRNAQALLDDLQQETPLRKRIAKFFNLLLGVDKIHGLPYPKPAKVEAFKKPPELNRLYQAFVNHRFLLESDNNVRFCHEVLIREWEAVQNWAANTVLKERNRKVRNLVAGIVSAVVFMMVTVYAVKERDNTLIIQSRLFADLSRRHTESGNTRLGALLAIEALPKYSHALEKKRPLVADAVASLNQVINHPIEKTLLSLPKNWMDANDIKFSPDGQRILVSSSDGIVRIFDIETEKIVSNLKTASFKVRTAVYSPDRRYIVTAGELLQIWDAESGKELSFYHPIHSSSKNELIFHEKTFREAPLNGEIVNYSPDGRHIVTAYGSDAYIRNLENFSDLPLKGHADDINSAAYSPDGYHIVTASDDHTARIWDAVDGKNVLVLEGHSDVVNAAVYSPDAKRIITASKDRTARIWDVESGQQIDVLEGHSENVNMATYSPDGHHILTVSEDHSARIWDAKTGNLVDVLTYSGPVNTAIYSPDGRYIVTASDDGKIHITEPKTIRKIITIGNYLGSINKASFCPDGQHIATKTSNSNSPNRIWDTETGNIVFALREKLNNLNNAECSPDGKHIAATYLDGTAEILDIETGNKVASLGGNNNDVDTANYSHDGNYIITTSRYGILRIWDVKTGALVAILDDWHSEAVKYSPNGHYIASISGDKVRIWVAETGKKVATLEGDSFVYSPDDRFILTTTITGTSRVWDTQTGKIVINLETDNFKVSTATYSPDGRYIATASYGKVRIFEADSGNILTVLDGHYDYIHSVLFSPDGKQIVTSSNESTRIWDAISGKIVGVLDGHSAAYSPDGHHIVTAFNNQARIWVAKTGKLESILDGHAISVDTPSYSPNGNHILTVSIDGTARIWTLYEPEEILKKIKELNLRPLTTDERRANYLD